MDTEQMTKEIVDMVLNVDQEEWEKLMNVCRGNLSREGERFVRLLSAYKDK